MTEPEVYIAHSNVTLLSQCIELKPVLKTPTSSNGTKTRYVMYRNFLGPDSTQT